MNISSQFGNIVGKDPTNKPGRSKPRKTIDKDLARVYVDLNMVMIKNKKFLRNFIN